MTRTRRYPLVDLLLLSLCAVICGADGFVGICRWGRLHKTWLRERLSIAAIPSHDTHDTLGRVLCKLDAVELASCLATLNQQLWSEDKEAMSLAGDLEQEVIAFDGKRIKGATGNLNLLTAWASRSQLTLAMTDGGQGSDEQAAMRLALKMVDVNACLITADALHTQVETAELIVERGADYLLALKGNQGAACQQAITSFDQL